MSPVCRALGLGVREISVAAGTGADVLACGAGAAGPTPDVRHQPPGYPDFNHITWDILGYPGISRLIPKQGYPGISRVIPG